MFCHQHYSPIAENSSMDVYICNYVLHLCQKLCSSVHIFWETSPGVNRGAQIKLVVSMIRSQQIGFCWPRSPFMCSVAFTNIVWPTSMFKYGSSTVNTTQCIIIEPEPSYRILILIHKLSSRISTWVECQAESSIYAFAESKMCEYCVSRHDCRVWCRVEWGFQ
jgi:hypothetical protein